MTSEDLRSEIEKEPFTPLRIHMVSGKTIDVTIASTVTMMQNAILVLSRPDTSQQAAEGYNVIALRNIERLGRLEA